MNRKMLAGLLAAAITVACAVPVSAVSGKFSGPQDGEMKTVTTKQTIDTPDITYQNMKVKNSVVLSEDIGKGTVTLRNVEITGDLLIKSGGTVILDGVTCGKVTIQNPKNRAYVIVSGDSKLTTTYLKGNCTIEEKDLNDGGEGYVNLIYSPNVNYELKNVAVSSMKKGVNATFSSRAYSGNGTGSGGSSGTQSSINISVGPGLTE